MAGVELEVGVEGVEEVEEDSLPHSEVGVAMGVEVVMGVEEVGVVMVEDAELKIVMLVKIIIAMETSINGINVFFHFIFCVHCLGIFLEKWNKSKYFFCFIFCVYCLGIFQFLEKWKK